MSSIKVSATSHDPDENKKNNLQLKGFAFNNVLPLSQNYKFIDIETKTKRQNVKKHLKTSRDKIFWMTMIVKTRNHQQTGKD